MKIITVDAGKYQTNGLFQDRNIRFRTKMEEIDDSPNVSTSKNYYIKWEDKHILLGDGARYVDYEVDKHKLQHKLAVYTASAELLGEYIDEHFNLVVLSPLSMYVNQQAREEFRRYILNDHIAKFELDGEQTILKINDVTIFAEACGVPISNPNLFKGRTVGLLDIGGLNVNGMIFKDMKPITGTYFTENLGSLIIMERIRKELNKEIQGANIQEYQMDGILKTNSYLGDREASKEIIQSLLADHLKEILQIAKASNWDTKGLDIVVSGGGSLDLGLSNIQLHIPHAQMSNDPVWDNCKGGSIVGAMIYGR